MIPMLTVLEEWVPVSLVPADNHSLLEMDSVAQVIIALQSSI